MADKEMSMDTESLRDAMVDAGTDVQDDWSDLYEEQEGLVEDDEEVDSEAETDSELESDAELFDEDDDDYFSGMDY